MKLYDVLILSASSALTLQREDGSMPPGWNGPYHQQETPVRNTAHWLITFLKAYEITRDKKYKDAAKKCVEYLLSDKARPMNATFWHRKTEKKDKCNGLIGQAWTIEALSIASKKLHIKKCKELAKEVFLLHPFDEKYGLWRRVDIDRKILDFDYVFNHQLWFAACGSLIEDNQITEIILMFIDTLDKKMKVDKKGLVQHFITTNGNIELTFYSTMIKLYMIKKGKIHNKLLMGGYQSFNLYAFSLLKQLFSSHPLWENLKFLLSLNNISSPYYKNLLKNNRYGFPYNPVGLENAFIIHTFSEQFKESSFLETYWLSWQLKNHFNFKTNMMEENTEDPITLSARIYEAVRLPNLTFEIH